MPRHEVYLSSYLNSWCGRCGRGCIHWTFGAGCDVRSRGNSRVHRRHWWHCSSYKHLILNSKKIKPDMLVEASDATSEALDRAETADVAETAEAAFEDWIDDCWDCYTWFYTKPKVVLPLICANWWKRLRSLLPQVPACPAQLSSWHAWRHYLQHLSDSRNQTL